MRISTLVLLTVASIGAVSAALPNKSRPVVAIGDPIPVALTEKPMIMPDGKLLGGSYNRFGRVGMQLGATADGELVLNAKPLVVFALPIAKDSIGRFSAALTKGEEACETALKTHQDGVTAIDEWSWQGIPVDWPTAAPQEQAVSISAVSIKGGEYCSVGIKGSAAPGRNFQAFIPSERVSEIVGRMNQLPAAVAKARLPVDPKSVVGIK